MRAVLHLDASRLQFAKVDGGEVNGLNMRNGKTLLSTEYDANRRPDPREVEPLPNAHAGFIFIYSIFITSSVLKK